MFKITMMLSFLAGFVVKCDDNNYYIVEVSKEADRIRRPFYIYWNVPTMQCKSKGIQFAGLYEKFGIIQNSEDHFLGDKMVILYDPGLFPALFKNESDGKLKFRNGGLPQEGNLTKHIEEFEKSVVHSIPDENFDGVAVIDFESWRPIFKQNYGVLTPYKDISYDMERKRHPWWLDQWVKHEAERRFEESGRKFMEATLIKAKQLRTKARWGYYGFPYCFNSDHRDHCSKDTMQENDRCRWLWSKSDALFPSVYSSKSVNIEQLKAMIKGRVKEAARVVEKSAGILPYVWFKQRDGEYFDEKDLKAIFNTIYNTEESSGVVIWGSSSDVNTKKKCENLHDYIYKKFGPLVSKYAKYDSRVEENKVTDGDNLVTDTNIANSNTNIVKETTTVKNNELEFVFDLQEGPEGTINVVQPIEAINNNGIENIDMGEVKPEGSNVSGGQIVVSNLNKPNSEAVILFQQLNGLTIIDLLNKMFGKNVQFPNGTMNLGDSRRIEGKADNFAQDSKSGISKYMVNDEIDIKDIFDIGSNENHIITTEQSFDYGSTTQNPEYEITTHLIDDIGPIEKGFHFIDNVEDVFQNIHKNIEIVPPNNAVETSTKEQITNIDLKDSLIALKEVFSELRQKNLTSEPADLFSFLDTHNKPVVTSSTTEEPETFDVLKVITEANDLFFYEIPQNVPTLETSTPSGFDLDVTTEYDADSVQMLIPLRHKGIIKTNKNKIFNFNILSTTSKINHDLNQNIDIKYFETTQNTPSTDSVSYINENIDKKLPSTTTENIQSTTSQYLDDNQDSIRLRNRIFSTTEKYDNRIFSDAISMTTLKNQEITTETEFSEFGHNMLIPIKDPGDIASNENTTPKETSTGTEFLEFASTLIPRKVFDDIANNNNTSLKNLQESARTELSTVGKEFPEFGRNLFILRKDLGDILSNDNTTPKENNTNFESTTSNNDQVSTESYTTKSHQTLKQKMLKRISRKKYRAMKRLLHKMTTNIYDTTEHNNFVRNTIKGIKDINFLIYKKPGKYNIESTTSQYLGQRLVNTNSPKNKPITENERKKKYVFSDLLLNNYEDFNWLSNNYLPQGNPSPKTKTVHYETTTIKNTFTNIPESAEDDVIVNNFLNEYETASGRPLADLMADITIKSDETLAKDPEFTEVLSKEVKKLTQQGYKLNLNSKPFLYDAARRDLATGVNKSNHFLYPEKKFILEETTINTDYNTDSDNMYYNTEDPINIYSNNAMLNKAKRHPRTLKDLMLLHNASYPHSFNDQKADESIEYILNNELNINLEEEKDVKRDAVYDKSDLNTNFNRNNENLTTALDFEKPYIEDATNSCNQNGNLIFSLIFSYTITMFLC